MTRIVFFGNNALGLGALRWLRAQGYRVVGLVTHDAVEGLLLNEIIEASELPPSSIIEAPMLRTRQGRQILARLEPTLGLSVLFGTRIPASVLKLFPAGCFNLHLGYLPYNRGAYPNVWSIVDGTPAGVTLHRMARTLDTGPVVARRRVVVHDHDTGDSLYARLADEGLNLLQECFPAVLAGEHSEQLQEPGGTTHWAPEVNELLAVDPDAVLSAGRLVDIIRACTFAPLGGCRLTNPAGRRRRLHLSIDVEDGTDEVPAGP